MLVKIKKLFIFSCIIAISAFSIAQTTTLVSIGTDGKLTYKADAVGSVIPDYSGVGYKNSEKAIPVVPVVKTVTAVTGDNTNNVQTAINEVAAMPLQSNGFRGAILFKAGLYNIVSTITISASGIVLRGEGTSTEFKATGTVQYDLVRVSGGSVTINSSTQKKITDSFVPFGTKSVTVESGHTFVAGDWVYLRRTPNNAWISMLGMDKLADPKYPDVVNWVATDYIVDYERQILSVDGNKLYFDAPVMDIIDPLYANGYVMKISSSRITNVGIENMKMTSAYTTTWSSGTASVAHDENHGWNAIKISTAKDCWVKKVTAYYFGFGCVNIGSSASFVTVDSCAMYDPISKIEGGRRYSFNIDGQRNLVKNCTTRNGRHDFANGAQVPGPNVFYKCTASDQKADIGPHHRWATGTLFDNITGNGQLFVQDRDYQGTGHGWAGSQIMLWNCKAYRIIIQSPQSHHENWAIGCIAPTISNVGQWVTRDKGIVESPNVRITAIPSLFVAQLEERLKNLGETPTPPEVVVDSLNLAGNPSFEDDPTTFTVNESGYNVLRRTNNGFFDTVTQITNPTMAEPVNITPGMWIKKTMNTGYIKLRLSNDEKHTGNTGLHIFISANLNTPTNMTLWSNTVATQKLPKALDNSKKYIVSVWAKKDAAAGNVCDSLTLYMTDNTKRTLLSRTIKLEGDGSVWTKYETQFDIPAHVAANPTANFSEAYAGIGIFTKQTNQITEYAGLYIDDFSIKAEVETNTSTMRMDNHLAFVCNGRIAFATNENIPYTIFNINGNKVAQGIANNSNTITLAHGVYIVKIKNQTQKIVL